MTRLQHVDYDRAMEVREIRKQIEFSKWTVANVADAEKCYNKLVMDGGIMTAAIRLYVVTNSVFTHCGYPHAKIILGRKLFAALLLQDHEIKKTIMFLVF